MNIWIARMNKTAICSECGMPIRVGEPCIFGRLWITRGDKPEDQTKWVKRYYWHARNSVDGKCCWLERGVLEMEKRGFTETRGRKHLQLPKKKKLIRLALLRRRARVVQRLKFETLLPPDQQDIDKVIHLGSQLETIKEEIQLVGGVPNSWM